jgi:pyrimidine-specific ribonucleoside hydrolase
MIRVFACLLLLTSAAAAAHDVVIPVVIDTDAAPDDLRAICLLAAMEEIEILGVTVSDGSCAPVDGARKARALLDSLGMGRVPVGLGPAVLKQAPPWRAFCSAVSWGTEGAEELTAFRPAAGLIVDLLSSSEKPVTLLCLGPLTNISAALDAEPGLGAKIGAVIWYNDSIEPPSGTNYEMDPAAADHLLGSGLRLEVISNAGESAAAFDEALLKQVSAIETPYASAIAASHGAEAVRARVREGHLKLWDDLLPVYIRDRSIFTTAKVAGNPKLLISTAFDHARLIEAYLDILTARVTDHENVVFKRFPQDSAGFRGDLAPLVQQIIERHGEEEWRIVVLTNELHRHLGIYSIAGAKMGLFALQYLGAERDEVRVISYAGSVPPVSCFNDGLQVSTGATVGHGSLAVEPVEEPAPEAVFICEEGKLRLRLRSEYLQQVRADIARGIEEYGNLTPGYWAYVRALAIRYWLEWDRYEMFEIVEQDLK